MEQYIAQQGDFIYHPDYGHCLVVDFLTKNHNTTNIILLYKDKYNLYKQVMCYDARDFVFIENRNELLELLFQL